MRVSSLVVLLWQVVNCGRQLEFLATMDRHVDVSGEHAVSVSLRSFLNKHARFHFHEAAVKLTKEHLCLNRDSLP